MRIAPRIVALLALLLIPMGCATLPPERAARRSTLEAAATECQRSFPVVVRVEIDSFDRLVAWYTERTSPSARSNPSGSASGIGFDKRRCSRHRLRSRALSAATTSMRPRDSRSRSRRPTGARVYCATNLTKSLTWRSSGVVGGWRLWRLRLQIRSRSPMSTTGGSGPSPKNGVGRISRHSNSGISPLLASGLSLSPSSSVMERIGVWR